MNTLETAEVVPQEHRIESTASKAIDKSPTAAACDRLWLRRGLLLCAALMAAWLAFNVHSSLKIIEAEVEAIRANLLLPQ